MSFSPRNNTARKDAKSTSVVPTKELIDTPRFSIPLYEKNLPKLGANIPAITKNIIPLFIKTLKGTFIIETSQRNITLIVKVIIEAEKDVEFLNPFFINMLEQEKKR